VDGKLNVEPFFQVYQDFANVSAMGEKEFGKGNFSVVLLDMYNQTLKQEIRRLAEGVMFVDGNDLNGLPEGNIVTVNSSLKAVAEICGRNVLLVPSNTQAKIDMLVDCFNKATERVQGTVHTVLVK
ncbi:MAG: hypothetical protein K2L72_00745, partial [Clostridia bacterium]|nr:hypothetical protein [Clostridia bacterium]